MSIALFVLSTCTLILLFKALRRLHQLEILGRTLKAEYANDVCEKLANTQESR